MSIGTIEAGKGDDRAKSGCVCLHITYRHFRGHIMSIFGIFPHKVTLPTKLAGSIAFSQYETRTWVCVWVSVKFRGAMCFSRGSALLGQFRVRLGLG